MPWLAGEIGETVPAIRPERQRFDAGDGGKLERAVEMRKQRAAARGLPSQRLAEPRGIDADQQQIALAGEMLGRRFGELRGGGEMNEAVAQVGRGAGKAAGAFGLAPERRGDNFVDRGRIS